MSGIEEQYIRAILLDISSGFGKQVGVCSGYVCSIVAPIVTGRPVKWIEDRMDKAFAGDYWMADKLAPQRARAPVGIATSLPITAYLMPVPIPQIYYGFHEHFAQDHTTLNE